MRIFATIAWCLAVVVVAYRHLTAAGPARGGRGIATEVPSWDRRHHAPSAEVTRSIAADGPGREGSLGPDQVPRRR